MKKLIIPIMLMLLVLPSAFAFGPHFHNFITDLIKMRKNECSILKTCLDGSINEESYRAGSMLPDIVVMYYYSEGGKNYISMHNWNFQQEVMGNAVTEDEKCFAWGIAAHLIADNQAHTDMVPNAIERTKVPNWLTHPLVEKKMDSQLISEHPELMDETKNMLNAMYGSKGDRYIEMVQSALGENSEINVKKEVDNLAFALDAFYQKAFVPKEQDNSLFAIYPYIDKITNAIHPYVGKGNVKDMNTYIRKTADMTISTFNNWGSRYPLSPHGFSELSEADSHAGRFVSIALIILIIASVLYPLHLVYRTRRFNYAFLFLGVIVVLLLAITVIYALL